MLRTICLLLALLACSHTALVAQQPLPDSCKLHIGTNLSGLADWMTEMPFVNLMRHCRSWGTGNVAWKSGGKNPWDSGVIDSIAKDADGYPLEVPFYRPGLGLDTAQMVYTVWANTTAWPAGTYVLLYDGDGEFDCWGDGKVQQRAPGRYEITVTPGKNNILQLRILRSNPANHLRNIRFLMPDTENTYLAQPYYRPWLDKVAQFRILRFMDWGQTNNWGYKNGWEAYDEDSDSILKPWSERASMTAYTWTLGKGVPYEIMIDVCNTTGADMWICIPHNASPNYIRNLATLVRDRLSTARTVYVEYSNEVWNWGFGQTQWLDKFGCKYQNKNWPEGIVPYIQRCLDIWTDVFRQQPQRLVRVVGVQAAWQDVSNRIVFNLRPGSFDRFSPAAYFGLSDEADKALDALGTKATAADIARWVRASRANNEMKWLREQQRSIAKPLNLPMVYYEGGQHITPMPFGQEPTYAKALLDIQRDTAMYNLYSEWFAFLRSLNEGRQPDLFMNFSFVNGLSARYGSWGILETIAQDTTQVPAPKYRAVLEQIYRGCDATTKTTNLEQTTGLQVFPNPATQEVTIRSGSPLRQVDLADLTGIIRWSVSLPDLREWQAELPILEHGLYVLRCTGADGTFQAARLVIGHHR